MKGLCILLLLLCTTFLIEPVIYSINRNDGKTEGFHPKTDEQFKSSKFQYNYKNTMKITQFNNPEFGTPVYRFSKEFLDIELENNYPIENSIFAISPDSRLMVSSYSYDNWGSNKNYSVYFWDVTTGRLISELNNFDMPINSLAISPDGLNVAIVFQNKDSLDSLYVDFLNLTTAVITTILICNNCSGYYNTAKYTPDGRLFVVGAYRENKNNILLWDIENRIWLPSIEASGSPTKLLITSDSSTIIASCWTCGSSDGTCDNSVSTYNIESRKEIKRIINRYDGFDSIALSSDGIRIATAVKNEVTIWDINNWTKRQSFKINNGIIDSLTFSPNGQFLLLGISDSRILLLDLQSNTLVGTLFGHSGSVNSLKYTPDNTMLISSERGFSIIFWNMVEDKSILGKYIDQPEVNDILFNSKLNSEFLEDYITVSASPSQINIHGLDNDSFNKIFTFDLNNNEYLHSYDIALDKSLLVTGHEKGRIKIWNITSEEEIITINGAFVDKFDYINSIKFSPSSNIFATASRNGGIGESVIHFWNTTTFSEIRNSGIVEGTPQKFVFSPDAQFLASYDLKWNESLQKDFAFVELWNVSNGLKIRSIKPCGERSSDDCILSSLQFSPKNNILAFGLGDYSWGEGITEIKLWNYSSNSLLHELVGEGHDEVISSIIFSSDGNLLFSGSGESGCCGPYATQGSIKIWNATNGILLQNLIHTELPIISLTLSPDDRTLVSISKGLTGFGSIIKYNISLLPVIIDLDLDGLEDNWEWKYNLSSSNFWDKFNDNDNDGLINSLEFFYGTNPQSNDTDSNGVIDGMEFGFFPSLIVKLSLIHMNTEDKQIDSGFFDFFLLLLIVLGLVSLVTLYGFTYYRKQIGKNPNNQTLPQLVNSMNFTNLKMIYHKIIVGLENIKKHWLTRFPEDELDLIIERESDLSTELVDFFPIDIQQELKSELRGRAILILIELAYQFPKNTHITSLSKILNIPQTTVSYEVKKLLLMGYIESITDIETLKDTRFKYFSLTAKGTLFLHLLKESLARSIIHLNPPNILDIK